MSHRAELNQRINEIAECLEAATSCKEIIETYTAKWNAGERTIKRYIALAQDIVAGRMQRSEALLEAARAEAIAETTEQWMRSSLELEARLCAIAEGQLETEKIINTGNGLMTIMVKPTYHEMIRAIDTLLRLRGNYNPKLHTIESGPVIFKIQVKTQEEAEWLKSVTGPETEIIKEPQAISGSNNEQAPPAAI